MKGQRRLKREGDENRASLLSSEIAHRLTEENVLVMLTELHLTPRNHFPLTPWFYPLTASFCLLFGFKWLSNYSPAMLLHGWPILPVAHHTCKPPTNEARGEGA